MNYKLKKEYIGKPTGVSDVSILFEEEPNYGKSSTIKYEITKHDKIIYDSPAAELLKKLDELSIKCLQLKKKLDIAISVLKRYEITDEFEGGVGSEYEDMMWACTEALKQIKEVK